MNRARFLLFYIADSYTGSILWHVLIKLDALLLLLLVLRLLPFLGFLLMFDVFLMFD